MIPILPLLILLLLGPANAERLAYEGRLPAAWLAYHRAMITPTVVVAVVEEVAEPAAVSAKQAPVLPRLEILSEATGKTASPLVPGAPVRAGPSIA